MTTFILVLVSAFTFASEILISRGVGYDKEGKEKKFTYERYRKEEGDKVISRAVYKDMDGDVMTEETMVEKNGELVRYDMDQKQLKQKAWIVVKDGQVEYNLKKFRKNNYPITDELENPYIVGLQIVDLIRANWDKLLNNEEVEFHLGVWHRQETIGFEFSQESKTEDTLVVKMNPSSMFIRAVVNPLYFHMDRESKKLKKYVGRATPKEKRGRDYYDFDALVKYEMIDAKQGRAKAQDEKVKKATKSKKAKAKSAKKK